MDCEFLSYLKEIQKRKKKRKKEKGKERLVIQFV